MIQLICDKIQIFYIKLTKESTIFHTEIEEK